MSLSVPSNQLRSRLLRRVMAVIAVAMVATACAGNDGRPAATRDQTSHTRDNRTTATRRQTTTTGTSTTRGTSTTTTGSSATTTIPRDRPSAEQEVIDRYVGYWNARFAANSGTPDPQDPALAEYATGAQLGLVRAETKKNLDAGLAFRPRPHPADIRRVTVVSLKANQAVVQECFVDDGLVVRRDTGAIVNDTIATHNVRGELVRVGGVWRVSKAQLVQRWEGVAGCALDS